MAQFGGDLKVRRIGATDQAAQQLRTMIADGRIPQGTKLPEIPLAEVLGVSRNTIRDAIRVLVSEGLVTHALNRGAVVRVLAPQDVADIYGIRRRLEVEALDLVPQAHAAVRAQAHRALKACASALDRADYGSFVEHELEFHAALVAHLGSPRLDRFFAQVIGELRLLFGDLGADSEPTRLRAILERYRSIYASAEDGDAAAAKRGMIEHLSAYESRLGDAAAGRRAVPRTPGG
jgi:DNA-binding GntR family transcriptional regulator